jgi:hypothetical protein
MIFTPKQFEINSALKKVLILTVISLWPLIIKINISFARNGKFSRPASQYNHFVEALLNFQVNLAYNA